MMYRVRPRDELVEELRERVRFLEGSKREVEAQRHYPDDHSQGTPKLEAVLEPREDHGGWR